MPAGAVELGLTPLRVDELETRLASRRDAITWCSAEMAVLASLHGPPDGLVPRHRLVGWGSTLTKPIPSLLTSTHRLPASPFTG